MSIRFNVFPNPGLKKCAVIVFDIQEKEVFTLYYNDHDTLKRISQNTYVVFWPIPADLDLIWLRQLEVAENRQMLEGDKYSKMFTRFITSKDKSAAYDEIYNILKENEEDTNSIYSNNYWKYSSNLQCMVYSCPDKSVNDDKVHYSKQHAKNRIRERYLQKHREDKGGKEEEE